MDEPAIMRSSHQIYPGNTLPVGILTVAVSLPNRSQVVSSFAKISLRGMSATPEGFCKTGILLLVIPAGVY